MREKSQPMMQKYTLHHLLTSVTDKKKGGMLFQIFFPSISHIQLHITEHAPQIYIKNTALLWRIISIKITEKNKLSSINVRKVILVT